MMFSILLLPVLASLCGANLLGRFVLHDDLSNKKDLSANRLDIVHQPKNVDFAQNPGPIPSSEVTSMLSLAMGVSANDITWPGLRAGSFFNKPKALAIFTTEDLPAVHSSSKALSFPLKLSDGETSIVDILRPNSYQTLTNHVTSIFDGHSNTLSISADEGAAEAGFATGRNSHTVAWEESSSEWKVVDGKRVIKSGLKKEDVMKKITTVLPFKGFTFHKQDKKVVVHTPDVQVLFDLERKEDFMLFSELIAMQQQVDNLFSQSQLLDDGNTDVYLLSISSLTGIKKLYGSDSKKMKGAALLVEDFIARLTHQLSKLYKQDILIAHLRLASPDDLPAEHTSMLASLHERLDEQVKQALSGFGTDVHVGEVERDARTKLCGAIQVSLASLSGVLKFICHPHSNAHHSIKRRSLLASTLNSATSPMVRTVYDPDFPVIFNIWLWLVIIIALAVYAISVNMWNMDPGDSIIYRLTQQKIKSD